MIVPLAVGHDDDLVLNALFRLSNGLACPVFGPPIHPRGVEVRTADSLICWEKSATTLPAIYQGFGADGKRVLVNRAFTPYQ